MRLIVSFAIEGENLNVLPIQSTIETAVEALRGVHLTENYRIEVEES